ncbi:MAG: hypothetical protein Q9219_000535 [cf. Caloplaca sp. 3 TL-2023]
MVLAGRQTQGANMDPPRAIQKTFGQHTAALSRQRTLEKTARAAAPTAAAKTLTVSDRIAARKERTLASLGPKTENAIRRKVAAKEAAKEAAEAARKAREPCSCCRPRGEPKKKVTWVSAESLNEVREVSRWVNTKRDQWKPNFAHKEFDQKWGFAPQGWMSFGYEQFPDEGSDSEDEFF